MSFRFCCSIISILFLPVLANGLSVKTDRSDAIYHVNTEAKFIVSAETSGTIRYILSNDGQFVLKKGTLKYRNAPVVIAGTLNKPGFLRCTVTFIRSDTKKVEKALAAAGFDPTEIKPAANHMPKDFDEFWNAKKQQVSAIPMNPIMKQIKAKQPNVQLYDVTIACLGLPVMGYYAKPKTADKESCPAILFFRGAGVKPAIRGIAISYAQKGFLAFSINALGIENGKPKSYYRKLAATTYKKYMYIGRDNRDKCFFTGMFLRAYRALAFLKSRDEWDKKNLIVYGSSQGGAQAIAAAYLDKNVTFLFAGVPAMCNLSGSIPGWPRLVPIDKNGKYNQTVLNVSKYVDCVNFASKTYIPALFTVGFVDNTCRPTSVYAAYNSYAGPKEIINEPTMGHAILKRHKHIALKKILASLRK